MELGEEIDYLYYHYSKRELWLLYYGEFTLTIVQGGGIQDVKFIPGNKESAALATAVHLGQVVSYPLRNPSESVSFQAYKRIFLIESCVNSGSSTHSAPTQPMASKVLPNSCMILVQRRATPLRSSKFPFSLLTIYPWLMALVPISLKTEDSST